MNLDFIGVGVTRSGTTWTWQQLVKHPQICSPLRKEFGIFKNKNKERFAQKKYNTCNKKKFIGEYVPQYFHNRKIIKKIKQFPNTQLLLLLRNPIDRIFTQYKAFQLYYYNGVSENFMTFFNKCQEKEYYKDFVNTNKYMKWLPLWHNAFEDKLLINLYDDLVKDSLSYIQGVYKHIGIKDNFIPPNYLVKEKKPYNIYYDKMPIKMSSKDKKYIKNFYKETILGVQDYLRIKTNWLET